MTHHPACDAIDLCDLQSGSTLEGAGARLCWNGIGEEVRDERVRAHEKHGDGSAEQIPWDNFGRWQAILFEEAGECARAICEFELGNVDKAETARDLRGELVQLGAMTEAWAKAIDRAINS